ncbi:Zinc finger BED domain-containing protein 1 [Merluccius polli]|uniref:Zinc finger BED domain-containing protein 1 n=1 Tax=Merluccius polli TaxID=89951 RepID=A0AA47NRZ0_MERPO|nr:Zinc finger BED domain-containing protein 1 [Merluccius polli]
MSVKKKSKAWEYFDLDQDGTQASCRLCPVKLAYKNSTGSMRNHLQSKHLDVNLDGTENSQTPKQARITAFTSPTTRRCCDPGRSEKIHRLITEMTAVDMLPLSFVEGKGFNKLLNFLEPEYTVAGRKLIMTKLEVAHANMTAVIKAKMAKAEYVAITSDGWTATTTESYMTITGHCIVEGEMVSRVLQTCAMEERHTAANLAEHLRTSTSKWGLEGKVIACVHDNAANMVLANETILDWESVPCFAHTLQLAVHDGLKANAMTRLTGACSRLVGHFHHSTVATNALKKKQAQLFPDGENHHKLIQSCKTRWNWSL